MTTPILLAEKFRRPEPTGLPRPRLEQPLLGRSSPRAGGRRDLPLAGPVDIGPGGLELVIAPPGSGKTTLLARVAAMSSMPVGWYRVTSDETAEPVFVAHLARALHDAYAGPWSSPVDPPLGIISAPDDLAALLHAGGMTALLAAIDRVSRPALLVLDDLHEIGGTAAEHALERFLALRPAELRVLVGSRRQPGVNVPRLRVSGALREITSDDLRFRSWEVEELFGTVFDEPLSPESAAALTQRTGGWAAALQLFHLATVGRTAAHRAQAVADLGGRSRLIRSYLTRNVLAELPPERRRFLTLTSTLGTLTGKLCDALLTTNGSALVLDELEQRQLFTSSDEDGRTFRYHEVLRTHLELALVEEYGSSGAAEWYARSAALLEAAGEHRAAVRAYARAEDWPAVTRLIRSHEATGSLSTDADLLLPPGVLETDPWLALVEARRRLRGGAVDPAIDTFRLAESLLNEPDFQDRCRTERTLAGLWSTSRLRSVAAAGSVQTGSGAAAPHWTAALRAATVSAQLRRPAGTGPHWQLTEGITALLSGDLRTASTLLPVQTDDLLIATVSRLAAAAVAAVGGSDESDAFGTIAVDAEQAGLPWVARLARGLHEATLVATGAPAWRAESCERLPAECDAVGDAWGGALLQLAAGMAGLLAESPTAGSLLADAARRFELLGAPVLRVWARAVALHVPGRDQTSGADQGEVVRAVVQAADQCESPGARLLALAALQSRRDPEHQLTTTSSAPGDTLGLDTAVAALLSGGAGSAAEVGPNPVALPPEALVEQRPGIDDRRLYRPENDRPALPATRRPELLRVIGAPAAAVPAGPVPTGGSGAGSSGTAGATADLPVGPAASSTGSPGSPIVPAVQIRCFGGFRLRIRGQDVDLGGLRPLPRALLRLLSISARQELHRERLIDLFWPNTDLATGTRRLQVAVSSIRQVFEHLALPGTEILHRQGDAYRLILPAGSTVDVLEFEDALRHADQLTRLGSTGEAIAARERALRLYRGELLPEDGPAEAVVGVRERLRLAAADTAARLASELHAGERRLEAVAAARRSVELDAYQDLSWDLLTDLYEHGGDHSAAERTRREHARVQAELICVD